MSDCILVMFGFFCISLWNSLWCLSFSSTLISNIHWYQLFIYWLVIYTKNIVWYFFNLYQFFINTIQSLSIYLPFVPFLKHPKCRRKPRLKLNRYHLYFEPRTQGTFRALQYTVRVSTYWAHAQFITYEPACINQVYYAIKNLFYLVLLKTLRFIYSLLTDFKFNDRKLIVYSVSYIFICFTIYNLVFNYSLVKRRRRINATILTLTFTNWSNIN